MGISVERHEAHVAEWLGKFSNYKKKWPEHLFHHANVEAAIDILKQGQLLSRNDAVAAGVLGIDIAPEEIIQNREDAHDYARLYFRPRTPTQYHIEGIRKEADYYMGRHAGFLVVLAFDGETVLKMQSTQFSTCNMQSPASQILDGDCGFDQLDFQGIYHDEAYPSDDERRKRCAEVLANSPLDIPSTLKAILVRTDADAATVKHLLIKNGLPELVSKITKPQSTGIFFDNYTAVQFVDAAPGRIKFKLRGTRSVGDIETELEVRDEVTGRTVLSANEALKPFQDYYIDADLPPGDYRVSFTLESCFAYEAVMSLGH
ncbi:hypothetical protein FIU85_01430 [Roseovarius sp. THAF8]|uniref:DarT ssDNA thymidine ADP-ribosyltransferase family protein n=1 Tax=Roseovarius sp. THAF8 TaxID=2587846 RepID=UPI00126980CD|nr:DarT ssDNA thymidine ADP-ribosyltransferase family protein [Roseovarius sp. THAF8]QFT95954.1 hypothetical protein FIU85_01430 [Roseovarius sp. THAF8]